MEVPNESSELSDFKNNLLDFHKSCKQLAAVLPLWIKLRKNSIICSNPKYQPQSTSAATSTDVVPTAQFPCARATVTPIKDALLTLGRTAVNIAYVALNVCSLGVVHYSYLRGVSSQYTRKLGTVAEDLRSDFPETEHVKKTVKNIINNLSVLIEVLESNKEVDSVMRWIDSHLAESPGASIIKSNKLFLDWSKLVKNLMYEFVNVLNQSTLPNQMLKETSTDDHGKFPEWIETLKESLIICQTAKELAHGSVESVESLLEVTPSDGNVASRENLIPQLVDDSLVEPRRKIPRYAAASDSFKEIDDWLEQIFHLYRASIDVAEDVVNVLFISGLARRRERPRREQEGQEKTEINDEKANSQ